MTRTSLLCLVAGLGGLAVAGCVSETPPRCNESLAEFCTGSLPCPMTWTAAQDPASWGGCANRTSDQSPILLETCGNVTVAEMWGIDASTNYYYDATTGALLAVHGHQANRPNNDVCVAGEADALVCDDPAPRSLCP